MNTEAQMKLKIVATAKKEEKSNKRKIMAAKPAKTAGKQKKASVDFETFKTTMEGAGFGWGADPDLHDFSDEIGLDAWETQEEGELLQEDCPCILIENGVAHYQDFGGCPCCGPHVEPTTGPHAEMIAKIKSLVGDGSPETLMANAAPLYEAMRELTVHKFNLMKESYQ
jgi:hypothetical protein